MSASHAIALALSCTFCCVCDPCRADNHRPFTYAWMASEAEVIAIGKLEESKRVVAEHEQDSCSEFVSTVRVLYLFKGTPKTQSLMVVHHRWARENKMPLANPTFAEMSREMAIALDAIDIGQTIDVSKYPGHFLMFLRERDGKYFPGNRSQILN